MHRPSLLSICSKFTYQNSTCADRVSLPGDTTLDFENERWHVSRYRFPQLRSELVKQVHPRIVAHGRAEVANRC